MLSQIWGTPFISYYPLKQGLKQYISEDEIGLIRIYILLSIKTRIETTIPGEIH